jgi:Uma2 family endonuclease
MKEYLTIQDDEGNEQMVEEPRALYGFNYTDYLAWKFKERIELIRGRLIKMCAAPSLTHQRVSLNIEQLLGKYLEGSPCQFFHAPIDVRLKGRPFRNKKLQDDEIRTVVQPDIIVVCDPEKLHDNRFVDGAPDFVIEILSPGNTKTEMQYKLGLYQENCVKEYWVVYPEYKQVMVFLLNEQEKYDMPEFYNIGEEDEVLHSSVIEGFKISLQEMFKQ